MGLAYLLVLIFLLSGSELRFNPKVKMVKASTVAYVVEVREYHLEREPKYLEVK